MKPCLKWYERDKPVTATEIKKSWVSKDAKWPYTPYINKPKEAPIKRQLFLDMDGVLADFDKSATELLGGDPYKYEWVHGSDQFWETLNTGDPDLFLNFPMMPDADELLDRTLHLNPIILTALPRKGWEKVDKQKREWVRRYVAPGVPVITVHKDKARYAAEGDVLVDDRSVYKKAWEARAGAGNYVVHTSVADTIRQLQDLGWNV